MSTRNSTITSYFKPKNGESDKGKNKVEEAAMTSSRNTTTTPSQPEEKAKNKRTPPGSPPPSKRRDTKPSPSIPQTHLSSKDLSSNRLSSHQENPSKPPTKTLSLTSHTGSIFTAPPHTLLIHACNTRGSWGAGIALTFKQHYPRAYTIYHSFCTKDHNPVSNPVPTGTALLIPPVDAGKTHWIGCLFTSAKYGKGKDKEDVIVRNTGPAMRMLLELVEKEGEQEGEIGEVRMCKVNSGKFGVPWERSVEVLEGIEVREGGRASVQVWEP